MQVSHEAGKVVRYLHLFKNFPQFFVVHNVKGFSVVSEAEDIHKRRQEYTEELYRKKKVFMTQITTMV